MHEHYYITYNQLRLSAIFICESKQSKAQLQQLLTQLLTHDASDKIMLAAGVFEDDKDTTSDQNACYNPALMANHEETATRIVFHCVHSLSNFIVVAVRDTDVIILLLAHSHLFAHKSVLVTISNQLYLNIGTLATNFGPDISDRLLLCHGLTKCNSVSFFLRHWETNSSKDIVSKSRTTERYISPQTLQ